MGEQVFVCNSRLSAPLSASFPAVVHDAILTPNAGFAAILSEVVLCYTDLSASPVTFTACALLPALRRVESE